jgi:hypothetical protein
LVALLRNRSLLRSGEKLAEKNFLGEAFVFVFILFCLRRRHNNNQPALP